MIVMDKPLLDSTPQEGNTESYSRSLRASSTLENFRREYFRKFSVITKIMKIFSYKNLAPYGINSLNDIQWFIWQLSTCSVIAFHNYI